MRIAIAVLVIAVITVTGYIFFTAPEKIPDQLVSGPAAVDNQDIIADTAGKIDEVLRREAESYVREISAPDEKPVAAETANNFVTRDQVISLAGKQKVERLKPSELLAQEGITEDSPITVITEQQQVETLSSKQILSEAGGKLDAPITILDGDEIRETTVEKALQTQGDNDSITVVKKVEQFEIRTPREILADESIDDNTTLNIIKEPYRLETTTVGELLMGQEDAGQDNVFYVRNVTDEDKQGIWGIVHNGLIENFATGIALRRGETIRKYRISIPEDADEMKDNHTSSYLGRLIQKKTSESFVYNYKQGNMGRNPDLIYPGQEIIIISFSPEELISIYQHFVENANS